MKQYKTLKLALVMSMGLTFFSMGASAETSWYSEINTVTNNTGQNLSDTSISNKIKDTLLAMQDIDSDNISIRTEFGHDSKAQEEKILQVIEKIAGVKSVDSDVNIKS